MSDDMMELFRQTYLEESFDGLSIMEANLLALPEGDADLEQVNTIFRAAHSMKGGAGTFGFSELINLTHVLETLLDQMRSAQRDVSLRIKEVLLESVDVLRGILWAYKQGTVPNFSEVQRMEALLAAEMGAEVELDSHQTTATNLVVNNHFEVSLTPVPRFFERGIDLIKLIRELKSIKGTEVRVNTTSQLPVNGFNPMTCYLSFDIEVSGAITKSQIEEVFEWLDDDCPLLIAEISDSNARLESSVETASATLKSLPMQPQSESGHRNNLIRVHTEALSKQAQTEFKQATEEKSANPIPTSTNVESSIRVSIGKIDQMVDLVGEMVIAQSMLNQFGIMADMANMPWADKLKEGLMTIERHTRTMQESVMSIRMMPISFAFNRMPRIVHDVSTKLGKDVELVMKGEQTEVDKTVLEKLTDPLVHIIRNAVDHGLEVPDVRTAAGKPRKGTIELSAFHSGGNIVIRIVDNGAGINIERVKSKALALGIISEGQSISDKDVVDLIFHAGFSTAEQVTDISGRGVGMDVVRRNIKELGGTIEVETQQGKGSIFTIRLPLTLAILEGQLSRIDNEVYIFPLAAIVETIKPIVENIKYVAGKELFKLRDRYLPILRLNSYFGRGVGQTELVNGLLVVVEHGKKQFGVFVDNLETQQQVVIKSMEQNYRKVEGVAGATILGDGRVSMILEIAELAKAVGDINE